MGTAFPIWLLPGAVSVFPYYFIKCLLSQLFHSCPLNLVILPKLLAPKYEFEMLVHDPLGIRREYHSDRSVQMTRLDL